MTAGPETRAPKARNAAASREALLVAAQALFGQRGFEATTLREIGERAGVDPALVARYFGSKADLYVAAVVAEGQGEAPPPDLEGLAEVAAVLLARTDAQGLGPVTQALVRADTAEEVRQAARSHLMRRTVEPVAAELGRQGVGRPRLAAEVAVAALMGVNLGRALGWFDELAAVPRDELLALLGQLVRPGPDPAP